MDFFINNKMNDFNIWFFNWELLLIKRTYFEYSFYRFTLSSNNSISNSKPLRKMPVLSSPPRNRLWSCSVKDGIFLQLMIPNICRLYNFQIGIAVYPKALTDWGGYSREIFFNIFLISSRDSLTNYKVDRGWLNLFYCLGICYLCEAKDLYSMNFYYSRDFY